MNKLIYKGAINSLSFGNVSYNLLREMYRKNMSVCFFPFGDKIDFSAFDKADQKFASWVNSCAQNRFNTVSKETKTLSQWHISGSESRISSSQTLFTFYELDQPTTIEKSIVQLQDSCVFGSSHARDVFSSVGCDNVSSVPLGFDEDFVIEENEDFSDKIHFGIMGKFEKRKNTAKIIQNWIKKYGNNYDYQLTCCIHNPFYKEEQMSNTIQNLFGGKKYGNVNFLPRLTTNSEVNHFLNSIDIDLTGLSCAEGWNIPSFNATALGKWSIVMNHTSHKDWANSKNSILVEPDSKIESYDDIFFTKGSPFNQGNINQISDEKMILAFEEAEKKAKQPNKEGIKLQKKFTYEQTLNKLIDIIKL